MRSIEARFLFFWKTQFNLLGNKKTKNGESKSGIYPKFDALREQSTITVKTASTATTTTSCSTSLTATCNKNNHTLRFPIVKSNDFMGNYFIIDHGYFNSWDCDGQQHSKEITDLL